MMCKECKVSESIAEELLLTERLQKQKGGKTIKPAELEMLKSNGLASGTKYVVRSVLYYMEVRILSLLFITRLATMAKDLLPD
jgi:hypothetical protein